MSRSEVEALSRAHQLFAGSTTPASLDADTGHYRSLLRRAARLNDGLAHGGYQLAVDHGRQRLSSAAGTDAAVTDVLAGAHRDRAQARDLTQNVLDAARADATTLPSTPLAQREAMRRRVARLRTQRAHIVSARLRARRHHAALLALRYRLRHGRGLGLPPNDRAAVAVRAALSRLGRPYVWGASGRRRSTAPGSFSGATRGPVFTWTAPHISRSTTAFRFRVRRCDRVIWSFRTPVTSSSLSATTWLSRRRTRGRRCE